MIIHFRINDTNVPKYKPRHSDYDRLESPDHEEFMDTTQIIRDSILARQLQYEERQTPTTTDLNKVRQSMRDSVYARQLDRCQQLGIHI